jgi:hypothetical protein
VSLLHARGLNLLLSPGSTSTSVASLGCGFELTSLNFTNTVALVGSSISSRFLSLRLELARLRSLVVTELSNFGSSPSVTLVGTSEAGGDLGGGESTLGQDRVGYLSVLGLGDTVIAPDSALGLFEGLQVQGNTTFSTLEAKLMVGVIASLEGLKRISSLATLHTGFAGHCCFVLLSLSYGCWLRSKEKKNVWWQSLFLSADTCNLFWHK